MPIVVGDTFTEADIAAGIIAYDNNGTDATNDSFGLQTQDTILDATSAEETSTVTVTANGDCAALTTICNDSESSFLLLSGGVP